MTSNNDHAHYVARFGDEESNLQDWLDWQASYGPIPGEDPQDLEIVDLYSDEEMEEAGRAAEAANLEKARREADGLADAVVEDEEDRAHESTPWTGREAADLEDTMFESEARAHGLDPDAAAPGASDEAIAQILSEGADTSGRVDDPTDQAIDDAHRAVSELRTERETFERWAEEARQQRERAHQQGAGRPAEANRCRELG